MDYLPFNPGWQTQKYSDPWKDTLLLQYYSKFFQHNVQIFTEICCFQSVSVYYESKFYFEKGNKNTPSRSIDHKNTPSKSIDLVTNGKDDQPVLTQAMSWLISQGAQLENDPPEFLPSCYLSWFLQLQWLYKSLFPAQTDIYLPDLSSLHYFFKTYK